MERSWWWRGPIWAAGRCWGPSSHAAPPRTHRHKLQRNNTCKLSVCTFVFIIKLKCSCLCDDLTSHPHPPRVSTPHPESHIPGSSLPSAKPQPYTHYWGCELISTLIISGSWWFLHNGQFPPILAVFEKTLCKPWPLTHLRHHPVSVFNHQA